MPLELEAHLRFLNGDLQGRAVTLPARGLTLSRGSAAGQRGSHAGELLLGDNRMSRPHARIEPDPLGWQLVDLDSTNRGYVDGRAFGTGDRVHLLDGVPIRLGDTLFVFRCGLPPCPPPEDSEHGVFPGDSPAASAVRERIRALGTSTGHVLIIGETGTGKERIAHALKVSGHPFVPLNCAELTRELARSELFGHVRNAFTGANAMKAGLVEIADTGTLFLDELGDMALDVQADLLRFLEDGRYRPLGAIELRHSSARVVAATNADLDEAVRNGRFRRDLLARMRRSNAPLELPPLRNRREDIPGWVQRFAAEASIEADLSHWSAGVLECLLVYPWPDNLRELRGVVRGLAPHNPGRVIGREDLPERVRDYRRKIRGSMQPANTPPPPLLLPPVVPSPLILPPLSTTLPAALPVEPPPNVPQAAGPTPGHREPSREEIEAALMSSGGSMLEAAKLLQIERTKLYRLCKRFGIDLDRFRDEPDQED